MDRNPIDINNESKCYLDEKELFVLYYLYRNKHISTMWSNVFVPNPTTVTAKPDDTPEELFERMTYRGQSVIVLRHLLDLGKLLDEEGFSIYCNADYSLVEGGFLTDYIGDTMSQYLEDTEEGRKDEVKYKKLNEKTIDFLKDLLSGKRDTENIRDSVMFTNLANPQIEAYREAVLNEKADKDFIELVDKLIIEDEGGRWDTEEVEKFLKIWYGNNKSIIISKKEGIFYENHQQKLARIIFENIDIHLNIKSTEKLEKFLISYIEQFKSNALDGLCKNGLTRSFFSSGISIPLHTKMFGYKRQREVLLNHIEDKYKKYQRSDLEIGSPYVEPEYIGDDENDGVKVVLSEVNEEKELFLFVHTMITLAYDKELKIEDFCYGSKGIFDMYDRGFLFNIKLEAGAFGFNDAQQKENIYFYEDKSILCINKKEIKVQKFKDQYHTLRIMFEEPSKEWYFSEISEKCDVSANYPDKKFYNAIYQINQKLKGKGIEDFFITTRQSVKINDKYLS